jgi:hypothetical protein
MGAAITAKASSLPVPSTTCQPNFERGARAGQMWNEFSSQSDGRLVERVA